MKLTDPHEALEIARKDPQGWCGFAVPDLPLNSERLWRRHYIQGRDDGL